MASGPYSFIDIAVLDEVRARFAAGDALAILTVDLDEVIWANGPGAALLGYADIEAVMGGSPGLGFAARRQISATPGYPRMGRDRPVAVRLASGMTSRAVQFLVSAVTLPDGEPAVLLAVPVQTPGALAANEVAARIIDGFGEAGYFAALIGEDARPGAATPGFAGLGIAPETFSRLVEEVAQESDRLVKRLIPANGRLIPAGIARLTDEPALHLLIAIDETVEETGEDEDAPAAEAAAEEISATGPVHDDTSDDEPPAPSDADLPERIDEDLAGTPDAPQSMRDAGTEDQEPEADDWYFGEDEYFEEDGEPAPPPTPQRPAAAAPELSSEPVRFVWRTDATGAFSAVSEDFSRAIGGNAADVIGRTFRDVAAEFGLDPDGEIAGLLERRDTWSGRTVLWPVEGTDLAVPVDLAALPVYNRDRVFEGFRGFGVARMGDAATDPAARGVRLAGPAGEDAPPAPETGDAGEDPFKGEIPVISISDRLKRRESDKVIRLAEHRPPQAGERQLSPGERTAFEEIRARLQEDYEAGDDAAEAEQDETPGDDLPEGDPLAIEAADADVGGTPLAEHDEAEEEERQPEPAAEAEAEAEAARPISPVPPVPPLATEGFTPSAFSAEDGRTGVDAELIAGLPLPLLVHAGDELYFANREFLGLTGYASLDQIRREGGLDRLFVDSGPEQATGPEGKKLVLRTLGGEEFPVDAHLQSTRWQGRSALLLALRRLEKAEPRSAAAPVLSGDTIGLEEMERRVAEMRTIIDTATDGVVLIAPDGTIRTISRPAEALFGFDSAEVEGKPFETLFAIESKRAARDYLSGLAENGVASVLNDGREVIGREAEGRFIPLFMTIGRLPGDSGYCAVVRDITQWKRAEEELTQARAQAERASSQKTEFLARVSHEIRTPLNAIIGFSELMIDEKFGPIGSDRYRDYLRDINRSGNHVLDLVNDLLDISKIEAGEQEMHYEAVSLNDTLAESVAMMQPQANRDRVIIRSSLASKLPEVVADLRSVRQIALNLLSNAIRYTQAGGQVIVSTSYEPSGDVVMRVRDTGIGMTLSEIDQALKPFKQINALKRGRHDGTGLGLPLTKAMVEANRARFSISSTPGDGTMVEITFPSTRVLAD